MARATTLDRTAAMRILKGFKQTNDPDVDYKGVEITNISYTNKEGKPFTYTESGQEYAVVNVNAQSEYKRKEALMHLMAGEYQEACNTNISVNVTLDELEKTPLQKGMRGTLRVREVELTDEEGNLTGEKGIFGKSFIPQEAVKAATFDFEAELAKLQAKEPTIKA